MRIIRIGTKVHRVRYNLGFVVGRSRKERFNVNYLIHVSRMKIRRENKCMGKKILKSERNWAAEVVTSLLLGNSGMRLRKKLGNMTI